MPGLGARGAIDRPVKPGDDRMGCERGVREPVSVQASAMHSISMSNSSGQEPTVTKVRAGGSFGK